MYYLFNHILSTLLLFLLIVRQKLSFSDPHISDYEIHGFSFVRFLKNYKMGSHEKFQFSLKLPAFKGAHFLIATKLFNLYLKIPFKLSFKYFGHGTYSKTLINYNFFINFKVGKTIMTNGWTVRVLTFIQ